MQLYSTLDFLQAGMRHAPSVGSGGVIGKSGRTTSRTSRAAAQDRFLVLNATKQITITAAELVTDLILEDHSEVHLVLERGSITGKHLSGFTGQF